MASSLLGGMLFAFAPARPGKKEVESLVKEHTGATTTEERRAQILKTLRLAEPKVLERAVTAAVKLEPTRGAALDLAFALQLPGLYNDVKGFVDSALEDKVVRAIFHSNEKDAESFLFERWSRQGPETNSHKLVDAGFRTYFVDQKRVEAFYDLVANPKTPDLIKEKSREILKFQMVLSDEEAKAIDTGWKGLFSQFELRTRAFPIAGKDFLKQDGWENNDIINYRGRYILPPLGSLRLMDVTLQSFVIKAWVMVLDGDGSTAGIVMKKGNAFMGAQFGNGLWTSTVAGVRTSVPGQTGVWTEFVFKLRGNEVSVTVDGQQVAQNSGNYGSEARGMQFGAGNKGRLLVGAVDFQGD